MKKQYINPSVRVVEIECDKALMQASELGFGEGNAKGMKSRSEREYWSEED